MSIGTTKKSTWIKWLICLALAIICLVIPEQGVYTQQVKLFLAITVFSLALSAFELVPDYAVALLMPALWIFCGVTDLATAMSPWTTDTVWMVIGAFFIAASLEECGLLKRIAFWMMCKAKGSYFVVMFMMMLVGIVMNILTFGAAFVIVPVLAVGLCVSLNMMGTRFATGLGAACILGCATAHSYTYIAANYGVISTAGAEYLGGHVFSPVNVMLHNWPMFFVSLFILWIAYLMFRPKEAMPDITYFKEQLAAMGKINRKEKMNAFVLILMILYVFTVTWTGFPLVVGFILCPLLLFFPGIDGATVKTVEKTNFKTAFFLAGCMSIGTVATSLGLSEAVADFCLTLLRGNTSVIAIMIVLFLVIFVLNFLMTPLAIWALLTAPILSIVVNLGYDPLPFAYALNASAEAILFPYEYVPYLVVYGFGLMKFKDFLVFNVIRSVIVLVGVVFVMTGYWHLIGMF